MEEEEDGSEDQDNADLTDQTAYGTFVNENGTRRSSRVSKPPNATIPSFHNKRYEESEDVLEGTIHINVEDAESMYAMDDEDAMMHVLGVVMIQQFSLNKGLKRFGKQGEEAATKELTQIHDMDTFFPVDPSTLSRAERAAALSSLMFLVEKRDGRIKARTVADGSKQKKQEGYKKEDSASPTVSNEAVMITSAIEAHERRDVATIDVPNAYLHAYTNEDIVMLLKGRVAELMVLVDPTLYRKYIKKDSKGQSLLYVRMNKALYGLLESALRFYEKLVADLKKYGFTINPYDPCVANAMINGQQMTVIWHVDDLKVSHKDPKEIDKFATYLSGIYGEKLTVHRGKVHDYLGIDLDYSEDGNVKISMIKYIIKMIREFPEVIRGSVATPAAEHLFQVRDADEPTRRVLPEEQAVTFHHVTAQLLFVSQRARRDIQTAVAFLTTRVKEPDEDDWGKLKRVLRYLYSTLHMKLTLSVDNLSTIKWWVDASDNTHADCKGHTGAMMSLGKGATVSISKKHPVNTKSSTESEIVGADQALTPCIWSKNFIEAQGYTVEHNIMYQDNQAAMRLEVNGALSSSKRTKHIKRRYFFIKDKIADRELEVQYCPTELMKADILTKPKQGKGFRVDRGELMNVPVDYDDEIERMRTHPALLPRDDPQYEQEMMMNARSSKKTRVQHRSVLDKPDMTDTGETQQNVTWAEVVAGDAQTSKKGDGTTNHLLLQ